VKEPDQALPNLSDLGPDAAITGESASAIYDYWRKKRERLNRSLINLLKVCRLFQYVCLVFLYSKLCRRSRKQNKTTQTRTCASEGESCARHANLGAMTSSLMKR